MTFKFLIHKNQQLSAKRKRCVTHFLAQFSTSALFLFWFSPTPQEIQQTHLKKSVSLFYSIYKCVLETKDNICLFFTERACWTSDCSTPIFQSCDLPHKALPCWLCLHPWNNISFFLLSSSSCSPACHAILSAWPRKWWFLTNKLHSCRVLSNFCSHWNISSILSGNRCQASDLATLGSLFRYSCWWQCGLGVTWPCLA